MRGRDLFCKVCSNNNFIITDPESGMMICTNCGAEFSDGERTNIDIEYGIRNRTSLTDDGKTLGSIIGPVNSNIRGQHTDTSVQSRLSRLDKFDRIIKSSSLREANLGSANDKFERIKSRPEVSDITIGDAKNIYKNAQKHRIPRRTTIDATMAASVYLACRKAGISWTLDEIADFINIQRNQVEKAYRMMILTMGLQSPPLDPVKCIEKIAVRLEINPMIKRYANDYINNLKIRKITIGKNPMALAGAVLYKSCIHCNEPRTQAEIADASEVSKETLRKIFKSLN